MLTDKSRFEIREHGTKKGYVIVDNGSVDFDVFPTYEQAERHIHDILNVERIHQKAKLELNMDKEQDWVWRIVAIETRFLEDMPKVMGITPSTEDIIYKEEFVANSAREARDKAMRLIRKSDVAGLFYKMGTVWRDSSKRMMIRKHKPSNPSRFHLRLISVNRDTYM